VLGKGSGIDSVRIWLKRIGVQASDDEVNKILAAVKQFSLDRKRLLTEAEFRAIVGEIATTAKGA
jgi:isopropylmalate/homocitrate/citramalate synthase